MVKEEQMGQGQTDKKRFLEMPSALPSIYVNIFFDVYWRVALSLLEWLLSNSIYILGAILQKFQGCFFQHNLIKKNV